VSAVIRRRRQAIEQKQAFENANLDKLDVTSKIASIWNNIDSKKPSV
jgi:hypothetical protein